MSVDIELNGVPVRLLDTAGIREEAEEVEQEGIARAQSAIETSDVVIEVLDASDLSVDKITTNSSAKKITVINKIDLISDQSSLQKDAVLISAKTGSGLDQLRKAVTKILSIQIPEHQAPFSARSRHLEVLDRSKKHIDAALQHTTNLSPLELIAEELRISQQALGEITGEFSPDDLLDYVFREFCIGK